MRKLRSGQFKYYAPGPMAHGLSLAQMPESTHCLLRFQAGHSHIARLKEAVKGSHVCASVLPVTMPFMKLH